MQKTREELANLALNHIGESTNMITTLDSDDTTEAQAARDLYEIAREDILRAHNWSFNRRKTALTYIGECPTDEWESMFAYPDDCAVIHRIISGTKVERMDQKVPYEIASRETGTDTEVDVTGIGESDLGTVHILSGGHHLVFGDRVEFADLGGATELNGNIYIAVPTSALLFIIVDPETGLAVDADDVTAWTSGGTFQKVGSSRVIYSDTEYDDTSVEYGFIPDETDDGCLPDYPHDYIMAFTFKLAALMAPRFVKDSKSPIAMLERQAQEWLDKARSNNNKEPHYGPIPYKSRFISDRT